MVKIPERRRARGVVPAEPGPPAEAPEVEAGESELNRLGVAGLGTSQSWRRHIRAGLERWRTVSGTTEEIPESERKQIPPS